MGRFQNVLLAGAASLLTVATAQAADLPVKVKPIQYVKVCSLYGAGFYYIPGTDICLKVGGYLRAEADVNAGGTLTPAVGPGSVNNRDSINNRQFELIRAAFPFFVVVGYARANGLWHRAQLCPNGNPMDNRR